VASRGERLDRFLATAQTDLSRSRLQALIRAGRVRVNGRIGRSSQRLRDGDRVLIELPEPVTEDRGLVPEARELSIVFEDDSILVIDKPAGWVVHPGAGVRDGTLVHALLHHAPGLAGVGGPGRPGIVHRLDKDTSGLLVVAKTQRAHRVLVEAIQARRVGRTYLALVWGDPPLGNGEIETRFGRDPRDRKKMAVLPGAGRIARTRWRVLERFGLATLVEVRLETGRTHQIRVHFAHLGYPILGDPVYGGRGKKLLRLARSERSLAATLLGRLRRQALHACELELSHPETGQQLRFTSDPPGDFVQALNLLKTHSRPGPPGAG
jgi:23S rRNA pseudouridine1911/1915/1917 synthase